jgi:hypothetical protein
VSTPTGQPIPQLRQSLSRQHGASALVLVLVAAGAATIVASAVVHLYLWGKEDGYRAVPTVGPMFLIQGIAGCLLGPVMLAFRRVVTDAAGAAYMAGSLGALFLSINGGLFGFDETLNAPWVKFSLVDEIVGFVACLAAAAITLGLGSRRAVSTS